VAFRDTAGAPIAMDLDFRQEGPQSWDIVVETDAGVLTLAKGGAVLTVTQGEAPAPADALHGEYAGLYARFAAIIRAGVSDVDLSPLQHVADAFLRGRRNLVEPFVE
jgi:D-galactose 1-dehydrogenase